MVSLTPSVGAMIVALTRKHLVAWLGIIALLGNVLAGAFGNGAASKAMQITDEVLGALVICTPHGPVWGELDSDGEPVKIPSGEHCPACVTLAKAALAIAILFVAIVFALPAVLWPQSERASSFAARLSLGGIGSRAPPLSA
jgi:DUF2946 family protein